MKADVDQKSAGPKPELTDRPGVARSAVGASIMRSRLFIKYTILFVAVVVVWPAALGCGEFVAMDQIDVGHVRQAIDNVIRSPVYARECAQWSKTIATRKYGGADLAAHMIMRMTQSVKA